MKTRYSIDTRSLKMSMIGAGFDTYTAFAKAAGISDKTVSSIAKGKNPTYSIMCKMASTLNLSEETAGKIFFHDNLRVT